MRWALRKENHADIQIHGTSLKGTKNGRAKLNDDDVIDIRRKFNLIKLRQAPGKISDLAAEYGIHHATLIHVAKGKTWKHIPMEIEP